MQAHHVSYVQHALHTVIWLTSKQPVIASLFFKCVRFTANAIASGTGGLGSLRERTRVARAVSGEAIASVARAPAAENSAWARTPLSAEWREPNEAVTGKGHANRSDGKLRVLSSESPRTALTFGREKIYFGQCGQHKRMERSRI